LDRTTKKKRPLNQYIGPLTPAQAAEGIEAAFKNAIALLGEAELLLQNKRWQRAAALAILAIEEAGKPSLIRGILVATDGEHLRDKWKGYRTHTKKNLIWILPQLARKGATHLEELRPIYDESADHGHVLDTIKQIAIYSDAYGNCHWSLPENVVDESQATSLVEIARIFAKDDLAMTSEAELRIWVKHMGPVQESPMDEMKRALLACYAEAESSGVLQGNNSASDMVKFVL
jgi:AbiV family abortive infection protein